jgi:hypothetical protein
LTVQEGHPSQVIKCPALEVAAGGYGFATSSLCVDRGGNNSRRPAAELALGARYAHAGELTYTTCVKMRTAANNQTCAVVLLGGMCKLDKEYAY